MFESYRGQMQPSAERLDSAQRSRDLRRVAQHQEGIVLVTDQWAGKTTTMYALLHELENKTSNITTLEDPIEYRFDSIIQGQVNTKIGFTFSQGLKSILRQDPDVIMVGEMRDAETAEIAFRAALTGHLVFSSLHTNSVIDSFVRLFDMDLSASSLHQRFARSLHSVSSDVYASTAVNFSQRSVVRFKATRTKTSRSSSCRLCVLQSNRLFRSRTHEILEIDDELTDP